MHKKEIKELLFELVDAVQNSEVDNTKNIKQEIINRCNLHCPKCGVTELKCGHHGPGCMSQGSEL